MQPSFHSSSLLSQNFHELSYGLKEISEVKMLHISAIHQDNVNSLWLLNIWSLASLNEELKIKILPDFSKYQFQIVTYNCWLFYQPIWKDTQPRKIKEAQIEILRWELKKRNINGGMKTKEIFTYKVDINDCWRNILE